MTSVKSIASAAAIGTAMLIALSAPPALAGYIVDLTRQGGNVVATGSGPIDLTGLTFEGTQQAGFGAQLSPAGTFISIGPAGASAPAFDAYLINFTGPANFGSGLVSFADSGSGDLAGFNGGGNLLVPAGYISDSPLSDTSTYLNQTFSSLGATPGTYEWTWGSGANQNFTLVVGAANVVPEPSTWAMMLLGFTGVGFAAYRRRSPKNGCLLAAA
jgi:hypothetical protein